MKIKYIIYIFAILIPIFFSGTCFIFDTKFAIASIDWFSFFAGGFLGFEALYKLLKYKDASFGIQITRCVRIIIGFFIFLIHILQFFWGTNAPVFEPEVTRALIDWFAFFFGIFLMAEGVYRMIRDPRVSIKDQFLRGFRPLIGTCVVAIHLMQFIRDY